MQAARLAFRNLRLLFEEGLSTANPRQNESLHACANEPGTRMVLRLLESAVDCSKSPRFLFRRLCGQPLRLNNIAKAYFYVFVVADLAPASGFNSCCRLEPTEVLRPLGILARLHRVFSRLNTFQQIIIARSPTQGTRSPGPHAAVGSQRELRHLGAEPPDAFLR